ncbi:tetraacyldisaccharide 4'-kinase [Rosettibacter firmus]|uniref:tetraacyldisaccharide 4'-kinase n=1 Tax=Rosettibacter firmus TaxID=3111522 RepID=UPI00336C0516
MLKLIRIILSPFTFIYAFIIKIRNLCFDKGIFTITKVNAFIISVGNLTVGGSGKTPTVIFLAELMKKNNISTGILSRGYRRSSRGYLLVSDGKKIKTTVDQCGDEMYLIANETNLPAAVSERRVLGAKRLIEDTNVKTIILDDAFQHRWLYRDLDILIFDQRFLNKIEQTEQRLLPLGLMREPFESINRADLIIINRKFADKTELPEKLLKYFNNKKIFYGYYIPAGIFDVKTHKEFTLEEFRGQKSLVVCGIAKPYSFLSILENNNIDITNKMLFPDHKNYTLREIQSIRKKFYDTNAYSVLTTQKDAVKLTKFSKELDDIDIYYLKIEMKLENQEVFENLILNIYNNKNLTKESLT